MKKISLLLILISISFCSFSQKTNNETEKLKKMYIGSDFFVDYWVNAPENMDIAFYNRGVNVFGLYNFPIKESNYVFSMGLGISSHNLYSNSYPEVDDDGITFFNEISNIAEANGNESNDYKINKVNITYIDLPLDIRLNTKKGFRYSLGLKGSIRIADHTKYKGDDFRQGSDNTVKFKEFNIKSLENNRLGITTRIGYKWINFYAFYSITKLFVKGMGPEMYPISFGISITPTK